MLSKSRLVTLTGVGGTGKSRLALHVARELQRAFADGVGLVELAKLRDPSMVGDTVATALGLTDLSNRDSETVLVSFLAEKKLLLVRDNCEHLSRACANLTATLLPAAPGLRVLATSREPLAIAGEQLWPVPPLSVPRFEESLAVGRWDRDYEALALFQEWAAGVVPGFSLDRDNSSVVARLCQRLDGLALAIELATARLRALPLTDVLARIDDRFRLLTVGNRAAAARQQTLRATVEWSFDLCTELERTLWARLSVFAGGFDPAAAEQVCADDGVLADEVFTAVTGLVDKSLLIKDEDASSTRYRILETIREFGQEQLTERQDAVFRRRHRDYYLDLAERAEADQFGPNQVEWVNRFQAEQPNLWAALDFCLAQPGQARTGQRMVGGLHWYWIQRYIRDGRRWLDRALVADTEPSRERMKALWVNGWIAAAQGDTSHALVVLAESIDLARSFNDELALAHALHSTALTKWLQGELSEAAAAYERALEYYRSTGTVSPDDQRTATAELAPSRRAWMAVTSLRRLSAVGRKMWEWRWSRWRVRCSPARFGVARSGVRRNRGGLPGAR